jgi:branched-chain amino acid transport system substrate-binding protein
MKSARMILATALVLAVAVASTWAPRADAQGQTIKIGVLYDHSGPFSAAGSLNCWRGAKMIIDYVNEKGGVLGKYKIVQVDGDGQSKAEVAINEAERLLNVEKVDVLAGIYSSAHAVPLAEKVDKQKKFLWITTAIADAVLKDRHLQYTFRPQANGGSFGENSVAYVAHYSQDKLKKPAKDVRAAIIYEDGPYGAGVAAANEAEAKKQGMQVVLKEGYSIQAPDLSSLVTKLRSQRPDVLFHTGYNPDIALFLRQAKEQGLRVKVYVGHGAGHSQLAKLKETFGNEVEGFHTVDPPASQLIDPKKLKPGLGDLTQEMLRRYKAFEPTIPPGQVAPHVSMGFNNMWILLNDVLPRAIGKHGGFGPEALAKAARETDIPEGGTMQGYGVKFHPADHAMAGQNMRAIAAVYQVVDGELKHVYPPVIASLGSPPVVLPASSPWAAR